jgi:hypothetical protein
MGQTTSRIDRHAPICGGESALASAASSARPFADPYRAAWLPWPRSSILCSTCFGSRVVWAVYDRDKAELTLQHDLGHVPDTTAILPRAIQVPQALMPISEDGEPRAGIV